MSWQQEQHKDECELEKAATDALLAAKHRPLSDEEIMAVAYSAGVANNVFKELRK